MGVHVFGESPSIYFAGHINSVKILKQYRDSRFHNLSTHYNNILLCPRLLENNNQSASGVKCQSDSFIILLLIIKRRVMCSPTMVISRIFKFTSQSYRCTPNRKTINDNNYIFI